MIQDIVAALGIELMKIRRSMIFRVTIAASVFVSLMLALIMLLTKNPEVLPPGILKTKVAIAAISADWPSYIGFMEIASGALGIVLYGFVAGWVFGREYDDKTIKDIVALPISRSAIAFSKMLAIFLWSVLLALIMFVAGLAMGAAIDLPHWSAELIPNFARVFFLTALLSILLCPVTALVASAGRGTLPAIGFVILCMGLANLFGNIGLGAIFPWTIPMLYTGAIGETGNFLPWYSYLIVFLTCAAGIGGTVLFWKFADQYR